MHELKRTVLHFVKTKTAVRKQTSEQEDKAGKWLFLHVSCLCVWNPTDIFHAMFGHILRRTNEIAPVLFAVAPGNQLTIDLSTDLEAVDNIHLRCLGCSSTDVRFWLCPDFLQQTDLMKTSRKKSCLLPLRDFPNQGIWFRLCYANATSPFQGISANFPSFVPVENLVTPMFLYNQCNLWSFRSRYRLPVKSPYLFDINDVCAGLWFWPCAGIWSLILSLGKYLSGIEHLQFLHWGIVKLSCQNLGSLGWRLHFPCHLLSLNLHVTWVCAISFEDRSSFVPKGCCLPSLCYPCFKRSCCYAVSLCFMELLSNDRGVAVK